MEIENKDLVSVVVPVYNVQEFLPKCVDSILCQTHKNIEIILVDDGSSDESGKVCDNYATKDKRIKVIHKKNGGLSDARNVGIENANGKYICFIDSDDIIDKNFVLYHYQNIIKTNCDISISLFKRFYDEKEIDNSNDRNEDFEIEAMDKHNLILKLFEKQNIHYISACTKLYKKSLFETVHFDVGKLHEDEFIVYKIFNLVNSAVLINLPLYFYRERQGSITKTRAFTQKNLDAFYSIKSCYEFFVKTQYEQQALNRLINSTAYIYCTAKRRNASKDILKFLLSQYKKYYKMNKSKTLKQKLFNICPNLICLLKRV